MGFRSNYGPTTIAVHCKNAVGMAGAYIRRRLNRNTQYIAFTGSSGKTTSRDCLATILRGMYPNGVVVTGRNSTYPLAAGLMRVKHSDRFALVEIGISQTGEMARRAAMVHPHMAVITGVGATHPIGLPTLEITAQEKEKLLREVLPGGTAVLNGEDPLVRRMSAPQIGKTVYFGDCAGSTARAREVRSSIEDGLRFRLESPVGKCDIQVRLYGVHWTNAVLGSISAAIELGVPLDAIQAGLANVYAHNARLEPVPLPNGAIALRDEYNGSRISFEAALAFLKTIEGRRRFVVISEVRAWENDPQTRFAWISQQIAEAAEGVIFVGPHASLGASAALKAGLSQAMVYGFEDLEEAATRMSSITARGDVVLFRGRSTDHLTRLVYAQFGTVSCWESECPIIQECDYCAKLGAVDAAGSPVHLPRLAL